MEAVTFIFTFSISCRIKIFCQCNPFLTIFISPAHVVQGQLVWNMYIHLVLSSVLTCNSSNSIYDAVCSRFERHYWEQGKGCDVAAWRKIMECKVAPNLQPFFTIHEGSALVLVSKWKWIVTGRSLCIG